MGVENRGVLHARFAECNGNTCTHYPISIITANDNDNEIEEKNMTENK